MNAWDSLNRDIVACRRCPRLIGHCQEVAQTRRKAYIEQEYWGKPVPNFGNARVPLLIVGLAPGAHGANRTGRMFTGDRSGDWLYRAMHAAGFCNQPTSVDADDGLHLIDCTITAVCHCAPPGNRPTAAEMAHCRSHLEQTIQLCQPRVHLALGSVAWNAIAGLGVELGWLNRPRPRFAHGSVVGLQCNRNQEAWLVGSYHPSQQNTFTGRLTRQMLDEVFAQVARLVRTND